MAQNDVDTKTSTRHTSTRGLDSINAHNIASPRELSVGGRRATNILYKPVQK
jgi:hypothetical protein